MEHLRRRGTKGGRGRPFEDRRAAFPANTCGADCRKLGRVLERNKAEEGAAMGEFPTKNVAAITVVQLGQSVQLMVLFPILVFMVKSYHVVDPDDAAAVSSYAGFLASAFPMGMVVGSFVWGKVSDRVGRKPVLAIGCTAAVGASLALGFVNNYYLAVAIRLTSGLLNSITIMLKCIAGEILDKSNSALGMSILTLGWNVGTVLGPFIGGVLQCDGILGISCRGVLSIFERRPFLMAMGWTALLSFISLLISVFVLPETMNKHRHAYEVIPGDAETELAEMESGANNLDGKGHGTEWEKAQHGTPSSGTHLSEEEAADLIKEEKVEKKEVGLLEHQQVLVVLAAYVGVALVFILYDEVFPIFCAAPIEKGGLNFSSQDIGVLIGLGGLACFPFSMIVYPRVVKRKGEAWAAQVGFIMSSLMFLGPPISSLMAEKGKILWAFLLLLSFFRNAAASMSFTAIITIMNQVAPEGKLGELNGIGQGLGSIVRTVGPASGGLLWAASMKMHVAYHQFFAFSLMSMISAGVYYVSTYLKSTEESVHIHGK